MWNESKARISVSLGVSVCIVRWIISIGIWGRQRKKGGRWKLGHHFSHYSHIRLDGCLIFMCRQHPFWNWLICFVCASVCSCVCMLASMIMLYLSRIVCIYVACSVLARLRTCLASRMVLIVGAQDIVYHWRTDERTNHTSSPIFCFLFFCFFFFFFGLSSVCILFLIIGLIGIINPMQHKHCPYHYCSQAHHHTLSGQAILWAMHRLFVLNLLFLSIVSFLFCLFVSFSKNSASKSRSNTTNKTDNKRKLAPNLRNGK